MIWLLCFVKAALTSPFKPKIRLEAENAVLRHQFLRRKLRGRVKLVNSDRWFFIQQYRWFPSIQKVLMVIRPETLFVGIGPAFELLALEVTIIGRAATDETDLRALIRQMSIENSIRRHNIARHLGRAS